MAHMLHGWKRDLSDPLLCHRRFHSWNQYLEIKAIARREGCGEGNNHKFSAANLVLELKSRFQNKST